MRSAAAFLFAGLLLSAAAFPGQAGEPDNAAARRKAQKLARDGNWKEAWEAYEKLCLDPANDPKLVGSDLHAATGCLQNINRVSEIDEFREKVIAVHKDNWRLLRDAARNYMDYEHQGFMIAGKFERGGHRGGGKVVNSWERDRVRALQLMQSALEKSEGEPEVREVAQFYLHFAEQMMQYRGYNEAWRLQYLSDLAQLPDYEDGWGYYYGGGAQGAPVDEKGAPVFHTMPKSWAAAESDGQRWRWLLMQAMELNKDLKREVLWRFAGFLHGQFGVQTMAYWGRYFQGGEEEGKAGETGIFAVHTLGQDETIAKLATGPKRFKLPDEFNYIRIYKELAEDGDGYQAQAISALAGIFQNRRQYPEAVKWWERYRKFDMDTAQKSIKQITGNWGQFEPMATSPAGVEPKVDFRFRNGRKVEFEAWRLDVAAVLSDVKAYIKTRPGQLDWERANVDGIGQRVVFRNERKYIKEKVADWSLKLEPRPNHWDKRITVTPPAALSKAGAYLVTAQMEDGNVSRIVVWVNDTVIVRKPVKDKAYYFVCDAVTGAPLAKANVEFFGYWQEHIDGTNRYRIHLKNFAESTDADGQVKLDPKDQEGRYSWLVTATDEGGRLAYLGFSNIWYGHWYDQEYNQTKVFTITDRPVYRPKQSVKFKFWMGHARYDEEGQSSFANRDFGVEIRNPKGEVAWSKALKSDEWGGVSGEWELPADCQLGVYSVQIPGAGGGHFRVEEYKKPEFEVVVDAPTEPVMLGERIQATVKAKYYFGAPVTKGSVKYKVLRTASDARWYPVAYWDWFYGRGYWWFGYDYDWYPGWKAWGCYRPVWWWWRVPVAPPEVVAEGEARLAEDGTYKIEIDTGLAKAVHGDTDHRYAITAEVRDESRRTIVGTGSVLVARAPFKVYAWVDRGYYRAGDTVEASFSAQTPDGKPVAKARGELRLLRVTYDRNRKPVEKAVEDWKLPTDEEGRARIQINAAQAGQYRLSYKVTDSKKHTIEGGYVFVVRGEGFDGKEFRFGHLELVTDKKEYGAGDKVKLMINTDKAKGTVVLFVRPANGCYLDPEVIRLEGKSTVREIAVTKKDMPNFFVEAFTVADGKLHSEMREVVVPPEKRVLDVEVLPSAAKYKPGEKARIKIKLTERGGEPYRGSTVLSVYDKSVEYISGGSNVPEIREFFWKWRRHHYPQTQSSLQRWFGPELRKDEVAMAALGIFGATVADEEGEVRLEADAGAGPGGGWGERGRMMFAKAAGAAGPMPSAPCEAPAAREPAKSEALADMSLGGRADRESGAAAGAPAGGPAEPTVRKNFADTALWVAALTAEKDGTAEVELVMPENLTGWKIRVWAMGLGTKVGEGTAEVVTFKNLLLRMQAPRFFVQKDEVVLSANVHNYLDAKKDVKAVLELDGGCLELIGPAEKTVSVDAQGEQRVDWRVKVLAEGEAVVRMKALADVESDAMEMRFPVLVHGIDKMVPVCGVIRPEEDSAKVKLVVPAERRVNASRLEIRYSPTLAGAMVDALPYLVDYPYGCTEQTLNRFLPTVITQRVLVKSGVSLKDIREKRSNLNAQEIGDDRKRAEQWKRYDRNPVFDEDEVQRMVKEGVNRLTNMQLSDGGWGWFSGWGEHSYPHTTAYVVHGLQAARENGVAIVPGTIDRGVAWLKNYQAEQVRLLKRWSEKGRGGKPGADALDAFVFMVLVDAGHENEDMREYLYRDRNNLPVYAKAMFGMALHKKNRKEQRDMIVRNIEQFLVQDDENQTAYLNLGNEGCWWYWYGSEYEAQAYYLKLLALTDPKGEKASRLVKYLLNNRKHATYWNSTRDTAICVEAFGDYLKASGEDAPDMTLQILVDGKKMKEVKIDKTNLFTFDNKFELVGDAVETGEHTVELVRKGKGPVYFNSYLSYFTLEDYITKAGLEVKVERKYYRLKPVDKKIKAAGDRGQVLDQKVEKYERVPVKDLETFKSGELVEVELEIASKNDYEYLVFEDAKPAGFEPVEVRSGYNGNDMGAYVEFRDQKVNFFVRVLARGRHSISYRMRAEIPGRFSALPTRAYAMYAPELRANSDEIKMKVED